MASLETAALTNNVDESEASAIRTAIDEHGVELELDADADPRLLEGNLDDDLFADFFDQLEANDAACDIYVPAEFEDIIQCGEYRVGSAHALSLVLDELRDELFHGDDDDDDDGDDFDDDLDDDDFDSGAPGGVFGTDDDGGDSMQIKDDRMRHLWKVMYRGARTSIRERVCLFVHR